MSWMPFSYDQRSRARAIEGSNPRNEMEKSPVTEVDNPSQIAWQGHGLKLGLFLPHSGPLASARFLKEVAVEAEQLGFTALWVADAPARPPARRMAHFYQPRPILGWLAAVTGRIALGTGVLVLPYRIAVLTGPVPGHDRSVKRGTPDIRYRRGSCRVGEPHSRCTTVSGAGPCLQRMASYP